MHPPISVFMLLLTARKKVSIRPVQDGVPLDLTSVIDYQLEAERAREKWNRIRQVEFSISFEHPSHYQRA